MFRTVMSLPLPLGPSPAFEAQSPEQQARKKEFLVSRIERRWNFNKNAPNKAKAVLGRYEKNFDKIKKRIEGKKFNKEAFEEHRSGIRAVEASLMIQGLEQISALAAVFHDVVDRGPSDESANLPKFKGDIASSLKKHTSAYSLRTFQVYSRFTVERGLVKKGSLKELGYDESFIPKVAKALTEVESLIKAMEGHEGLVHKLGEEIVNVLMGPKAAEYNYSRRQFEITCTVFSSILNNAWSQYVQMALTIAGKIASCYE
jgi:hypothetical protein